MYYRGSQHTPGKGSTHQVVCYAESEDGLHFKPKRVGQAEINGSKNNNVIYDENGVVIRSFPAIHSIDGSVSYSLEWNGLKYVFGGDTYPNKWYIEYAKDADVASHECFLPPRALATYFGWDLGQATYVSTRIHTEPQAFGKVMSEIQPRLAVAYHFFKDPDTTAQVNDRIRTT